MSPRSRDILFRAARGVVVLVLLLLPWPHLGRAYASAFGAVATFTGAPFFHVAGLDVSLEGSAEEDAHHEWFAMVYTRDPETHAVQHRGAADLRRSGYMQIAVLLGLAAALPIAGRKRFAASVAACVALLAALGWLPVLMYLAKKGILHVGMVLYAGLAIAQRSLTGAPGMAFVVPTVLWLAAMRAPAIAEAARASVVARVRARVAVER